MKNKSVKKGVDGCSPLAQWKKIRFFTMGWGSTFYTRFNLFAHEFYFTKATLGFGF
jgi:hypothetical protein